jgi:PKHD-type hydroxylase
MTAERDASTAVHAASLGQVAELRSNVRVIDVATAPLLSVEACAEIVASCPADDWTPAARKGGTSADALSGVELAPFVDPAMKSRLEQPLPGGASGPFAELISSRVLAINDEVYRFRVVGVEEPTRVMCYRGAHADHAREHVDLGPLHPLRKLAFSVLLTDPDAFDGGDLEFSGTTFDAARVQGTLTVFPSFLPHKVTPMEGGVRHAVVGWVLGPTFV